MIKSTAQNEKITIFWFRRDLRLDDNTGLSKALEHSKNVLPMFIFDSDILDKLEDKDDARVTFLHDRLAAMKSELRDLGSDLLIFHGKVEAVLADLLKKYDVEAVYTNQDYEPSARARDQKVKDLLQENGAELRSFKDQVIFEKDEIVTAELKPYTVFTPYKKKWLAVFAATEIKQLKTPVSNFLKVSAAQKMLALDDLGFTRSQIEIPNIKIPRPILKTYDKTRDFPFLDHGTSRLGIHFRFGTISPRVAVREAQSLNDIYLSELIWREFFMQILWNFPHVEKESFRRIYDKIAWRNSKADFNRWKSGMTGYPLVDAGMRQLNETGFMHNRVRMVVASFLCKHLLIHWYEGERYFAQKLLDYDLSANNGNWQWAAGTGCDAAPYFRVFNPEAQMKKFDPDGVYVKRWVPEWKTSAYPAPMVVHEEARARALAEYKKVLKRTE